MSNRRIALFILTQRLVDFEREMAAAARRNRHLDRASGQFQGQPAGQGARTGDFDECATCAFRGDDGICDSCEDGDQHEPRDPEAADHKPADPEPTAPAAVLTEVDLCPI